MMSQKSKYYYGLHITTQSSPPAQRPGCSAAGILHIVELLFAAFSSSPSLGSFSTINRGYKFSLWPVHEHRRCPSQIIASCRLCICYSAAVGHKVAQISISNTLLSALDCRQQCFPSNSGDLMGHFMWKEVWARFVCLGQSIMLGCSDSQWPVQEPCSDGETYCLSACRTNGVQSPFS